MVPITLVTPLMQTKMADPNVLGSGGVIYEADTTHDYYTWDVNLIAGEMARFLFDCQPHNNLKIPTIGDVWMFGVSDATPAIQYSNLSTVSAKSMFRCEWFDFQYLLTYR
jgi:hypothetical protein